MKTLLITCTALLLVLFSPALSIAQSSAGSFSWFGNRTEAGIGLGVGSFKTDVVNGLQRTIRNNEIIFTLHTINGIKLGERAFLGLGVGCDVWQHGSFIPVFGHLSYDLNKKENPFVASLSLGYSFGTREETTDYASGTGAFMASVGLGYKLKISKKLKFIYEIFYKYQAIESTYTNTWNTSDTTTYTSTVNYKVPNHFVGFRIGIVY